MSIVASIALTIYGTMLIGMVCWKGIAAMRKNVGIAFVVIVGAFLHSMATKPSAPSVVWDDYLKNDGTCYTSNSVTKTGVQFKWAKRRVDLPSTETVYIARQATNESTWVDVATTTVGAYTYTLTLANPETYRYSVLTEWVPPSPVHTNGVWLGNVIEKAKGSGIEKMVIIHGKLEADGKVIAP